MQIYFSPNRRTPLSKQEESNGWKKKEERGEIIQINIKSYSLHEVGKTSSRIAISQTLSPLASSMNIARLISPPLLRDPNAETMHASDIFRSPNIPSSPPQLVPLSRLPEGGGGDLEWHVNRRHVSEDNTYGRAIAIPRILG